MFSPALRNRQRVMARQAALAAQAEAGKAARPRRNRPAAAPAAEPFPLDPGKFSPEYAALLAALHEDLRTLSDIQSHELRQPKKAEMARKFDPWIKGILEADQPVQDEILVTMMIWAVDCRDYDRALELAGFVLRHGLTLPERYTRTPACFLAEEIADAALQQHEIVPHEILLQVRSLTSKADMPDPVKARLHKAIGRGWFRKAQSFDPSAESAPAGGALAYVATAIEDLERALALWGDVGVKKDIQAAQALKKKLEAAAAEGAQPN